MQQKDSQSNNTKILQACRDVQDIVVGIRPRLVSQRNFVQAWDSNQQMLHGLERFLQQLLLLQNRDDDNGQKKRRRCRLLHISSVAAIHHVQEHKLVSICEKDPTSAELENPYDRFKRATEELVLSLAATANNSQSSSSSSSSLPALMVTNVRLGAIFSDDKRCIQCNALHLQSPIGCYLTVPIDCNSSRNVACLIHLMLKSESSSETLSWRPVYYYTRPTQYQQPVPYGSYLADYRRANNVFWAIWIPVWFVQGVVAFVHWLYMAIIVGKKSSSWRRLLEQWLYFDYLAHVDYLLQVTVKEHSFDLTAIQTDFPQIAQLEESIHDCFRRRRKMLNVRVA
jgi:hypothetical protein